MAPAYTSFNILAKGVSTHSESSTVGGDKFAGGKSPKPWLMATVYYMDKLRLLRANVQVELLLSLHSRNGLFNAERPAS